MKDPVCLASDGMVDVQTSLSWVEDAVLVSLMLVNL
jgi:hypothetical protein